MQLSHNQLNQQLQESLRSWLDKQDLETLFAVLESKILVLQSKAATTALESAIAENEQLMIRSNNDMKEAASIAKTVNLLKELRDTKQPFTTVTITP